MSYNVGQVEVTVLPNADRFNEDLAAKLNPRAREIGREMGAQMADGIRERLALIGDVNIGVDTTKAGLEVDKFLAETDAKAKVAGDEAGRSLGDNLAKSAADSGKSGSPLMIAAIAGGLIAGGPALVAAAGVAFGGIAAVLLHSNANVTTATHQLTDQVSAAYKDVAQVAVPFLVQAIDQIKVAAIGMAPLVGQAFQNLQPAIQGVTNGVIDLVRNALPGLVDAVKSGAPVFAGLESLLANIGTGLSNMFMAIDQHAPAMGAVLSGIGAALNAALGALGTLAGAGAELGAVVLPPLVVVLQALASVLGTLGPILPGIALAFSAWKIAGVIAPLLGTLATKLEAVGASAMVSVAEMSGIEAAGLAAGTGFEAAAAGARGLESAMGPIGLVLAGIGLVIPLVLGKYGEQDAAQKTVKDSADAMTQALQQSKGAIDDQVRATAAMTAQKDGLFTWAQTWGVSSSDIVNAALGQQDAISRVTAAAQLYASTQGTAANAAGKNTTAGLATKGMLQGVAGASNGALAALRGMSGATVSETGNQKVLAAAIAGSSNAASVNAARLQGVANAASAGSTQINLLKGALDALTGKAVTMDQAQIAVTQAIIAATTATKGQTGALLGANGQLDLNSAKGAAAATALMNLSSAGHTQIATLEGLHGSTAQVTALTDSLRAQFIKSAEQMNINADEAKRLADRYFGIPGKVHTEVTADTAGALNSIDSVLTALARIQNKTVTVTTVTQGFHVSGGGGPGGTQLAGAIGGIVHPYAAGGIEPMQGGLAQIVPPNALRVIGDRVTDDEAYIPINKDLRSIAIWQQAGQRMGQLAPAGASGGKANVTVNARVFVGNREITDIARVEADAVVTQAFNHVTDRLNYNP